MEGLDFSAGWRLREPGVLELPGTHYVIRWTGMGSHIVEWKDAPLGAAGSLNGAKEYAAHHARSLLEMGLEP